MATEPEKLRVIVEAFRDDGKARVSVGELGRALPLTNRIVNRLVYDAPDELTPSFSIGEEPSLVELEITEIRSGSVILDGLIQVANNPFAQNVAGGLMATAIYNKGPSIARSASGSLRKLGKASAGKVLVITIALGARTIRIVTEFNARGTSRTRCEIYPPDDTQ